jgi:putative ABC transport system substrate-binding protein
MKRRALLASLMAALLGTRFAFAYHPGGIHRLGIYMAGSCRTAAEKYEREEKALFKALVELGYVEGRNLVVEWRCFEMDFSRSAAMAVEIVRLGDVIFTSGTPQTKALRDATKTIPIVTVLADPVRSGLARSLSRPDGNITGLTINHPDSAAKEIEMLRTVMPKLDRLVLLGDVRYGEARELLRPHEIAARARGLAAEVQLVDPSDFDRIFRQMRRSGVRAAYLQFSDSQAADPALKLAIRYGVAMLCADSYHVEQGGLISYGMYHERMFERAAATIDKLFRGAKIADIPWELPDRSHLAINLGTAKSLGLSIPPDVLLRADQVIE